MRIALLADIHSNLEALLACLAHAQAHGTEQWVFLGDLVGYGADPVAVLDIVMAHAAGGAMVVLGNHDEAALGRGSERMHDSAELAIDWTRNRLRGDQREFLGNLPLTVRDGPRFYVHASACDPGDWTYVTDARTAGRSIEAAGATHTFAGHVHEPRLYFQGADGRAQPFAPTPGVAIPVPAHRRWLAIVGSCGQPRDGNPAASYAMLDTACGELTFHRLAYEHAVTARKIRAAGLPEGLATRIERAR